MPDDDDTNLDRGCEPLSRDAQSLIGRKLRKLYGVALDEPVPDRFQALLEQLETGQPGRNRS